jgi:hypothetical protein
MCSPRAEIDRRRRISKKGGPAVGHGGRLGFAMDGGARCSSDRGKGLMKCGSAVEASGGVGLLRKTVAATNRWQRRTGRWRAARWWRAGAKGAGGELGHAGGSVTRYIGARTPRSPGRARPSGAAAGVLAVEAMASGLAR